MDMAGIGHNLLPFYAVCKVIRRLGDSLVDSHTAFVGSARISALHRRSLSDGVYGSRCCHHPAGYSLVDC